MKKMTGRALILLAVIMFGIGAGGCVKAWEDEKTEVVRRPQVDVEPESPGWDDGGTEHIE